MWLIIFKILMFIYVDLFDLFDPTGRRHATGRLLVNRFYIGLANFAGYYIGLAKESFGRITVATGWIIQPSFAPERLWMRFRVHGVGKSPNLSF